MKCLYPVNKKTVVNGSEWAYQHRCGACMGCMLYRQAEWAGRMLMEAHTSRHALLATLTYDEEHYEALENGNLDKEHAQTFVRSLRDRLRYEEKKKKNPQKIDLRYYLAGEYGKETLRAHYHAAIFNFDLSKEPYEIGNKGETIWKGKIQQSWPHGFVSLLPFNPKAAMYVAKYIVKDSVQQKLLQAFHVNPFSIMSKRPPLGHGMLQEIAVSRLEHYISLLRSPSTVPHQNQLRTMFPDYVVIEKKWYPLGRTLSMRLSELLGTKQSDTNRYFELSLAQIRTDPSQRLKELTKANRILEKLLRS